MSFDELSEKGGSFSVRISNTRTFAIEMFGVYKDLSEATFSDLYIRQKNTCNFYWNRTFQIPRANTKGYNLISYFEPMVWNLNPSEIKYTNSLQFANRNLSNFFYIICKTFILRFLKWDKGPNKVCGRQSLKNLKGYGLLKRTIFL